MRAEVISIGDELTSGQRLDTNSQWLSQRLGELGVHVLFHTTVGDDLTANVRVFQEAMSRAEVVVCTGGLGPTADDLTRQALSQATGRPLRQDTQALAHIVALFSRRKRPMPESNLVQALFPEGSQVVPNPHGSAPGITLRVDRVDGSASSVFALPGVPAEMKEMWAATVGPAIAALTGTARVIRHRRIHCFGVGESDLEQMLPDLIRRGRDPSVGITVSQATITLRITAAGDNEAACYAAMEPTIATIRECLGDLVFGEEDDELQHVVLRALREQNARVATVEWGPGGLVANWLSEADPASTSFAGGWVIRDPRTLERGLGIDAKLIEQQGVNSQAVVAAMAEAACRQSGADYGLAIGPFPSSDSSTQEPGTMQIALDTPHEAHAREFVFAGHPEILKPRAGKQALDLLRLTLRPSGTKTG